MRNTRMFETEYFKIFLELYTLTNRFPVLIGFTTEVSGNGLGMVYTGSSCDSSVWGRWERVSEELPLQIPDENPRNLRDQSNLRSMHEGQKDRIELGITRTKLENPRKQQFTRAELG